jgi:hypothetical protein
MHRPRLIRGLRIAWSAVCGILCVLLIVLWVRSYSKKDICGLTFANQKRCNYCAMQGRIFLIVFDYETSAWAIGKRREWDIRSEATSSDDAKGEPHFYFKSFDGYYSMILPHPLLVVLGTTLAAIPWLQWRFSLRTLLIATTLIAVVLGLVVWAMS